MLKRLYKRFLLWVLAPVLEPLRVDEKKPFSSMCSASIYFDDLVLRAGKPQAAQASIEPMKTVLRSDNGEFALDMGSGKVMFRTQVREDGRVVQAGMAIAESGGVRYVYPDGIVGASMSKA